MIAQGASSSDMQNSETQISQLLVSILHFNKQIIPTCVNDIILKTSLINKYILA